MTVKVIYLIHCIVNNILHSLFVSASLYCFFQGSCIASFKFGHCDKILSLGPINMRILTQMTLVLVPFSVKNNQILKGAFIICVKYL